MSEELSIATLYERAEHAARLIRSRLNDTEAPRVALVLGSGLARRATSLKTRLLCLMKRYRALRVQPSKATPDDW
jgi:hypothetical protein